MLLKIPGNTKELLIWFSKSLLPLPQIKVPFCFASSGKISGMGFAKAKIMGLSFMVLIHSPFKAPAAETPMKISDIATTCCKSPLIPVKLVTAASYFLAWFIPSVLSLYMAPLVSQTMMSLAPQESKSLAIVTPAAPAPLTTTLTSSIFFSLTLRALMSAARTTMAVPCWSSWKTGRSFLSFKPVSISKHSGALISYRLTARKLATVLAMASTSSWAVFLGYMQKGTTSTSPSILKISDFPYITGSPAAGPIFPKPRIAVPSETIMESWLVLLQMLGILTMDLRFASVKYSKS